MLGRQLAEITGFDGSLVVFFLALAQVANELADCGENDHRDDRSRPAGGAELVHTDFAIKLKGKAKGERPEGGPEDQFEPLTGV